MTYFVSAIDQDSAGIIAREIEAEDFSTAWEFLLDLMDEEFGGNRGRITSITEKPELCVRFPGAVASIGVIHGETMNRRNEP